MFNALLLFCRTKTTFKGLPDRMRMTIPLILLLCCVTSTYAQGRQQFIRVEGPVVVLTRVRVIDGTGAAVKDDQTIVISGGKIQSIEPSSGARPPANARILDLDGYTVLPGLVGMHNHMFFPMGILPLFSRI